MVPAEPLLSSKGVAVALADGISTSDVSQVASETSVKGFLEDYYSTSDSWTVKNSVQRVLQATNSWLYAQTRSGPHRYDLDRGYVCTFSALVLKSATAHIFHVGDARVYRVVGRQFEQLTEDHRLQVSREKSYLSRALGMRDRLEIDYSTLDVEIGDTFVLATDGVYEFVTAETVVDAIAAHGDDLDQAAAQIVDKAKAQGSDDNLTIQIVRVDRLPDVEINELRHQVMALPFPPELLPRMEFDGYQIVRELHHSSRSHVYLAVDQHSGEQVALKVPSVDLRGDAAYLERFLMEEWVARRVHNIHVLKPCDQTRRRNYLYIVTEYIEGQTLAQWMTDNPKPSLEAVRDIIDQTANGLQALHRQEMLHQDLRPNNIMIDKMGTVKLIDFGSVYVSGLADTAGIHDPHQILGTAQYTAPEFFLGEAGSPASDQFSLGVIAYQMLSGRLPYSTRVARTNTRAAQLKLVYETVLDAKRTIPSWIDGAIRTAVHPDPSKRYEAISEFVHDLRHPNPKYVREHAEPLIERNPLLFWKGLSLILFCLLLALLASHPGIMA